MKKALVLAMLMLALGWANLAKADQIFVIPPGWTEPNAGQLVSATADFSLSGNTLTITLTNTVPSIHDAAQLLTDIFFTLSAPATPSLSSQTGDLIDIDENGVVTDLGSSTLGWGFGAATVNSMSGFEACVICQGGPTASATPSQGIIGPASGDGKYDNANASIEGNKPHNPFVNQSATFVLTDIPADATVGNVIFSFSTTSGDNLPSSPVPEPTSLLFFGSGLAGLALVTWRRKK
jgi:hypothetical protein